MVTQPSIPRFELIAGHLGLDFTNTLDGARGAETTERLESYADLLAWSEQAGIASTTAVRRLQTSAKRRPAEATAVLTRARDLREAAYRIVVAAGEGGDPAPSDLELLNEELAAASARARLTRTTDGFRWDWKIEPPALDQLLAPVVRSIAELLTSAELERVHGCDAERCTWLFLDTTRNRRRRWCNMKSCGNREKVRRHRARQRRE